MTPESLRDAVDAHAFVERRLGFGMPAAATMEESLRRSRAAVEADSEGLGERVGKVESAIARLRGVHAQVVGTEA